MTDASKKLDTRKLQELGVVLLVFFGSRAEGAARRESDYDVGALFDKTQTPIPRRYGILYALLQDSIPKHRLDLVDLDHAPYPLQFRAAMKGEPLYQKRTSSFADFRERAMRSYFDFQPILKIHEEALGI